MKSLISLIETWWPHPHLSKSGWDVVFDESSTIREEFYCPICSMVMKAPIKTLCGHNFCTGCINDWIEREPFQTQIHSSHPHNSNQKLSGLCPLDRAEIHQHQNQIDESLNDSIKQLTAYCPFLCGSLVMLSEMEVHTMKECPFTKSVQRLHRFQNKSKHQNTHHHNHTHNSINNNNDSNNNNSKDKEEDVNQLHEYNLTEEHAILQKMPNKLLFPLVDGIGLDRTRYRGLEKGDLIRLFIENLNQLPTALNNGNQTHNNNNHNSNNHNNTINNSVPLTSGNSGPSHSPPLFYSLEEISSLSIKDLKRSLGAHGVNVKNILEKEELLHLAYQFLLH